MRRVHSLKIPRFVSRATTAPPYCGRGWLNRRIMALSCVLVLASCATAAAQDIGFSKTKKPKPTPCSTFVSKCGCTITKSGFYQVQKALSTPGMLNPQDNSCIAVSAPRVTLSMQGYSIENTLTSIGSGIHLNASAANSIVAGGGSIITGWENGIEDEASNVIITNVVTDYNNNAGILVQDASNVTVNQFGSQNNKQYGVLLNGTTYSQISNGTVDPLSSGSGIGNNAVAGISVAPASKPVKPDNGPRIFGNCVMGNSGFGIQLQGNVHNAKVTGNEVTGNTNGDLSDLSNDCGSNLWFGNEFGTGSPATCTGSSVTITASTCP